ncbi:hypothetical protein SH668x_001015 [Planctomicrobium sp. SH668]|uniref:hypothetical protein n=1 Tax=Planctomicrobium sp. SH668 TaxID=3448126 RepID=UPI003F5B7EE2
MLASDRIPTPRGRSISKLTVICKPDVALWSLQRLAQVRRRSPAILLDKLSVNSVLNRDSATPFESVGEAIVGIIVGSGICHRMADTI